MKLYFAPNKCSLATHIALREAKVKFALEPVSFPPHGAPPGTAPASYSGGPYSSVNPKRQVPALQLDDGTVLTENAALLQFIAEQSEALRPKIGTTERYHIAEWLNFAVCELFSAFTPLISPVTPPEAKSHVVKIIESRWDFVGQRMKGRQWLATERYSVADIYLFICSFLGLRSGALRIEKWPDLRNLLKHIQNRPAVIQAFEAEGSRPWLSSDGEPLQPADTFPRPS